METKEDAKEELKRQLREGLVLNDKGKTLTPLLLCGWIRRWDVG